VIIVIVLAAGLGAAVWAFWPEPPAPQASGPGFNVLLITLDTTRADHLSCYGYREKTTPNIDALARKGTLFEQCGAPAPITLPSHSSIMTGTYPYVHGVRDNLYFQLAEANVTLAETLRENGYATAAHTAAAVVNREYGLAQGFDTYIDAGDVHERRGNVVCDGAIQWLQANAGRRFFMWVHLFDPHAPYEPPEPFRKRFEDPYDGEVAFADHQVGRLVDELRRLGLHRNTLLVVTADHGEGLGEHNEQTHQYFIYESTMHVPLILHCPDQIPAKKRVSAQVRLIDIPPTILAFLGLPIRTGIQGRSLVPDVLGRRADSPPPVYGESLAGMLAMDLAPLRYLRDDGWKYIHAPRPELYHVAEDPGETRNLADAEPQRLEDMREELRSLIAAAPDVIDPTEAHHSPSTSERQKLLTLGYAGGPASPLDRDGKPLTELDLFDVDAPDPKEHVDAINTQTLIAEALLSENYAEAERLARQLREKFPDSPRVAERLARSLFLQNRDDEAVAVYREIIAEHPGFVNGYYGIAKLMIRNNRPDEAIRHLRKAIEIDPSYVEAQYDLAVCLMREGSLDEAIEHYRIALELRPTYVDAMVNLAVALGRKGADDEAVGLYRRAIEIEPGDPTLYFNLGNALVRQKLFAEAAVQYEQALRIRPGFAPAQQALQAVRQALANP
jgi:arylsulfatase A-like enzyme/Flp pilus assembly protein TadD